MKTHTHHILMAFSLLLLIGCKENKSDKTKEVTEEVEEIVEKPFRLKTEEVTYKADTISMKGYLAYNENATDKSPGIIVIHEWWGHNEYVRQRADMLAELGYVALAIDMYGDGKLAVHPDDAGKFAMSVMGNIDSATARFNAAMTLLKSQTSVDADKIAAMGYCFGGSVALTMANKGLDLDAVAAFHSGVQLPVMPTKDIKAKILVCNGAVDPFIPAASVEAYKKAMDSVKADYKYIAYEGATHSFTSKIADSIGKKFNLPLAYQKEADEKSWAELQKMLADTFLK
ncbi:dienelactone hydrolase family protein [Aquimarina sp. MMG016]|uniref:dienelactone hydrolase family protein n=1 Tax=Aquimarina sp. MMG016 TaxID=2822690 RepID=UPI001B39CE84|nr:dienelactone hydrolase family protein [Aquimarina sp. MMG016]MBQ4821233.1 dienelactone hydrolase family protein [Aquimarina sp. MMG016]